MRLCFDIDGTICNNTDGKYEDAEPYQHMIDLVNELYVAGNYIIFHTARGMGVFNGNKGKAIIKWYSFTKSQLDSWGVKYHELHLGKLHADIYIDDKGYQLKDDGTSAKDLRKFLGAKN